MESVEPMSPVVEADERRELLEKQFEQVEETVQAEPRSRDEAGKFVAAAAEPVVEADPPVWKRPPASWKKDYHEAWNTADDRLKEYAWQREEQMRRGVESVMTKAQFADQMQSAIEPYVNTIRGMNLEPVDAVKALMNADHILRTSAPEQKLAYFHQLATQYGINLGNQSAPQQNLMDPTIYALQNELNNMRGEVMTWKQQQEQSQNQMLLGEINQFAQGAEHFEEARPAMIQLLQSGMAESLEDAYDKAIRINPELFETVQQAQQAKIAAQQSGEKNRAAKAARAAAVSVRSSTPGTNTAPIAQDRRSMLASQFDGVQERL